MWLGIVLVYDPSFAMGYPKKNEHKMKLVVLLFDLLLFIGCPSVFAASAQVLAVCFKTDPIDHKLEEAVEQVELTVGPASAVKIDNIPQDWSASATEPRSGVTTFSLGSGHVSFSVTDIRRLDRICFVRVDAASVKSVSISAKVWLTRGPSGAGRIVVLSTKDFYLKKELPHSENRATWSARERAAPKAKPTANCRMASDVPLGLNYS